MNDANPASPREPDATDTASTRRRRESDAVPELTAQFFVTLSATYDRVRPAQPTPTQAIACKEIEQLLKTDNWLYAYEIEQRLVSLFDGPTVDLTLQGRIVEAKGKLSDDAVALYVQNATSSDENAKRSLLARIIDDLQWHYTIEEAKRGLARKLTTSTNVIFVVAMAIFCAILGIRALLRAADGPPMPDLVLACAAGLWGASFSMLIGLKGRIQSASFDDMKVMVRKAFLWSRVCIGLGAGAILYLLLSSGLVAGQVFPDFTREQLQRDQLIADLRKSVEERVGSDSTATLTRLNAAISDFSAELSNLSVSSGNGLAAAVAKPIAKLTKRIEEIKPGIEADQLAKSLVEKLSKAAEEASLLRVRNAALLLVWCFLAGFSETLVPNLLAATEAQSVKKS
jgi:hypothetical protein